MKTLFTSDWHLGDDRIGINGKPNLFYRPFDSVLAQDKAIAHPYLWTDQMENGDTLWHLGDVLYALGEDTERWLSAIRRTYPKSKFNLIIGNYDEAPEKLEVLGKYFDTMVNEATITLGEQEYYLNHYPAKCIDKPFAITGHIHGLWKVQKNMINVGVDAWHFKPVTEAEIKFCTTAVQKYYDKNVFPY